jgi:hypothetical protein
LKLAKKSRHIRLRALPRKLGVLTITLLMAACASPKQYTLFAIAGSTYADAAATAVPEWLKLHIDYSSEQQLADQTAQPKLRAPPFSFRNSLNAIFLLCITKNYYLSIINVEKA